VSGGASTALPESPRRRSAAASLAEVDVSGSACSPESVARALRLRPSVRFGRLWHAPGAFEEKYDLREGAVLGSGMSGAVCLALARDSGAQVAVKTLSVCGLSDERRSRVVIEVENQLAIDHPNVARLLEVFSEPGRVRLVVERMRGPDLHEQLSRRRRFEEREAARCIRQVLAAVAHCHDRGICHRDLKLENFCLEDTSPEARVKMIDFGLSCVFRGRVPLTSRYGTLAYVAPEVLRCRYDEKCDLWSVGVMTYFLLDGKLPFLGRDDHATASKIGQGIYAMHPVRWQRISGAAKDFVSELLQVDASWRPTALAAHGHMWLVDDKPQELEPLGDEILEALSAFASGGGLKRAVLRAIAPAATSEQAAVWTDHFQALDPQGEGMVPSRDLARHLAEHCGIAPSRAAELCAALAEEGSSSVAYPDFMAACLSMQVPLDAHQCKSLFDNLDTDRSSTISVAEVRRALRDVADLEAVSDEFAEKEVTYTGFRWLLAVSACGPTLLGRRGPRESRWMSPHVDAGVPKFEPSPIVANLSALGAEAFLSDVVWRQRKDDMQKAWQVATIAAKEGCAQAVRCENVLWRTMCLRGRARAGGLC